MTGEINLELEIARYYVHVKNANDMVDSIAVENEAIREIADQISKLQHALSEKLKSRTHIQKLADVFYLEAMDQRQILSDAGMEQAQMDGVAELNESLFARESRQFTDEADRVKRKPGKR